MEYCLPLFVIASSKLAFNQIRREIPHHRLFQHAMVVVAVFGEISLIQICLKEGESEIGKSEPYSPAVSVRHSPFVKEVMDQPPC